MQLKIITLLFCLIYSHTVFAEQNKSIPQEKQAYQQKMAEIAKQLPAEKEKLVKTYFQLILAQQKSNVDKMQTITNQMESTLLAAVFDKDKYLAASTQAQELRGAMQKERVTALIKVAEQLNDNERKIFVQLLKMRQP
jgi:predicted PurR-regulated permease PerM